LKERTTSEIGKVDLFRITVDIYSKERGFRDKNRVCWATHKVQAFFIEKRNPCSNNICPKLNGKNGRHGGLAELGDKDYLDKTTTWMELLHLGC
jgi:hypothetical protein